MLASSGLAAPVYPLKVSANGRHLVDQNNAPFLVAGDSPQALVVNLTTNQAATFLANRGRYGFNTMWVNLLCNTYTGGRADAGTLDGILPFTNTIAGTSSYDLTTPNEAYFSRVDDLLNLAAQYGMVVLLDPIETGGFLQTTVDNGTANCRAYGQYLGNRFKGFPNVIWMSGNDFQEWRNASNDGVVRAVAMGIRDMDTNHLQTLELDYPVSSSLDDPTWTPIIGLNATYTYYPTYARLLTDYSRTNFLPNFMVEANYELEQNFDDLATPAILRRQEYWTMLSGACGQLFGNKDTWKFAGGLPANLDTPGTIEFGYMKALFDSRPWYSLIPDTNHSFLISGHGTYAQAGLLGDSDYATAARTLDGHTAMVYAPTKRTLTVDMSRISGTNARAWWYDPRTGGSTNFAVYPTSGYQDFISPDTNDWVLVLDDTSVPLDPPGFTGGVVHVATTWLPRGTVNAPYSVLLQASGGTSPYVWSLAPTSDSLPPGFSLATNGLLTGAVGEMHSNHVIVTVEDSAMAGATQSLTLEISAVDTIAPTFPAGLTARTIGINRINLSWQAASDNVAVTGYLVERSLGIGSTSFTPLSQVSGTNYADKDLSAATFYNYRVRTMDAAGNLGGYSSVASAASWMAPPSSNGLAAAYAFEEAAGITATDSSGNGNTGTVGGAVWTSQGKFGSALSFLGSGYVTINDSASLNLSNAMTLEAWVYPTVAPDFWTSIILKEAPGSLVYMLQCDPANRPATFLTTSSGGIHGITGPDAVPLNTWTHLAATYDGTVLRLYVNGNLVASGFVSGNIVGSAEPLTIGGNAVYGEYFKGTIDEVCLYNRVLSQSEIQAEMTIAIGYLPVISLSVPLQSSGQILQDGFRLQVSANMPGAFIIEFSTNFTSWETVQTLQYTNGPMEVLDSGANLALPRFYRARRP